ncbi:MAG TPA: LytTR family DNA-binding domain-containing protein [Bacteroidales bacterium]|nr:LytTR family DNA-binding domain-containing protein [Bacteroidales bacterium]HPF01750.1 LytTR family DNA-binding domain-containing protein [Bacteroidales bacterium]HPJ59730.1 LytTR family DNA-binding domain-containing protein [Bacteroidales bacterium]HPR11770.1 LytTR family DNA-binding domain-containing protein [Bacteroidales bacterium]
MKCIIIADRENYAHIAEMMKRFSFVSVLETGGASGAAVKLMSKERNIDLLIIDNDLPGLNSFELINGLDNKPNIIMVSSDDRHALEAFDFNVIDYMVKPLNYVRFFRAVDKVARYYGSPHRGNDPEDEVFIRKSSTLVKLKLKDIVYVEALENYVTVYTDHDKFTILFTMKAIETQLPSDLFIRIHRSYIVNRSKIEAIRENILELMVGGSVKNLPVGKSFREILMTRLVLMTRQ